MKEKIVNETLFETYTQKLQDQKRSDFKKFWSSLSNIIKFFLIINEQSTFYFFKSY